MNDDEEGFQAALDANPADHVTRLVLADWLQERGDPRAAGYRALGLNQKWPYRFFYSDDGSVWWAFHAGQGRRLVAEFPSDNRSEPLPDYCALPEDWIDVARTQSGWIESSCDRCGPLRRDVENRAALGFNDLPSERRAELLAVAGRAG